MDIFAVRTVRIHNWKWPKLKAEKLLKHYVDIIGKKYPTGIEESNQYFVVPGFEHVTKDQPIISYNPAEACWEVSTTTQFLINKK